MPKLVSVVIPLYKYEKYIIDCLLSCVNQEYRDVEIIVVDDCSPDRSVEMAKKINDPRIKIIELKENKGYSHAKNIGIIASKGEYITTIDADDMLTLPSIRKRVEYLERMEGHDVVHGIAYKFESSKGYPHALRKQYKLPFDRRCKIHAQAVMLRRETYQKYGLYFEPLRSKSDKEMWQRLRMCGARFGKIETKSAFYRIHKESMLAMRNRNKSYDKKITKIYNERIDQIKREGLTKNNTRWI